jgi:hypothetical protein
MAEMTVPNGERYGELRQKVDTLWTDCYTHTNGEPVVTTVREYLAVQKDRDKVTARRNLRWQVITGLITAACAAIEAVHLFGK